MFRDMFPIYWCELDINNRISEARMITVEYSIVEGGEGRKCMWRVSATYWQMAMLPEAATTVAILLQVL
jgi:hypothetical protein